MQLQLHYTNCTTPQLQLHYATTTTTAALHHTTSSSCGWGDRPGDHCNHCSRSKRHSSNHLSVHQWIRSAIRDSQQPTSPIGFLFFKLPPPPCAELLLLLLLLLLYLLHSLTFSFLVVRSWFLIVKSLTYGSPCSEIRSIDFPWQAWGWQQRFVTCRSSGFVRIRQADFIRNRSTVWPRKSSKLVVEATTAMNKTPSGGETIRSIIWCHTEQHTSIMMSNMWM